MSGPTISQHQSSEYPTSHPSIKDSDLYHLKPHELKELLNSRQIKHDDCLDKDDLVKRALEHGLKRSDIGRHSSEFKSGQTQFGQSGPTGQIQSGQYEFGSSGQGVSGQSGVSGMSGGQFGQSGVSGQSGHSGMSGQLGGQTHVAGAGNMGMGSERSSDIRSGDIRSGDMRSGDMRSGDMRSGDMRSGDMRSGDPVRHGMKSGDIQAGPSMGGDQRAGMGGDQRQLGSQQQGFQSGQGVQSEQHMGTSQLRKGNVKDHPLYQAHVNDIKKLLKDKKIKHDDCQDKEALVSRAMEHGINSL
jgi:predicted HTH domain antitoxin